ncbi:MAG TPA: transposase [Thermoanaerobaculia bacterium]|nr:transposase [Thermoanaerobaculia bacterium]
MKKRAKKRVVWQGGRAVGVSEGLKTLLRPMVEGIEATRQGLLELFHVAGVEALRHQLAGEVEQVVGPKRRRNAEREAYRWGSTPSEFVLGGRKVALERPRVRRRTGGEVALPSVRTFQDEDPFTARVIEQTLVGVSQRGYGRSLEALEESVPQRATSKSAVQRRLVAGTRRLLDEWLKRDLSDFQPLILMLDGLDVAGHTLVVALGIAGDGTKRVLGLREGATENAAVCVSLLQELLERRLHLPERFLVVLDGGKGLRKAVRSVFGDAICVQRCHAHYADLRIMPTCVWSPASEGVITMARSA